MRYTLVCNRCAYVIYIPAGSELLVLPEKAIPGPKVAGREIRTCFFVVYMRNYSITTANWESLHKEKIGLVRLKK